MLQRLAKEIDWAGAVIASASLATFSYVLAMLSADIMEIKKPANIVLLCLSLVLIPGFVTWMNRQERLGKPALIPNSIWKNRAFTTVCIMVLLSLAVMNSMELFCSLFFQDVQGTTALGASLRLLPNLLMGSFINLITGTIVDRVPAIYAVLISSGLCAGAPLLMALINPAWPYWYAAFFAQLLTPMSGDVLFTVGLIIVSDSFPTRTQALAGAVFNTASQLGVSIGLTTMSVISATVTMDSGVSNKASPEALMKGYRASFWTLFAWMVTACLIGGVGLRKLGKVGVKKD
jgi:MFS family permease